MLKKTLITLLLSLILTSQSHGFQSDYITYEWLVNVGLKTGYTDHVPHWRRFFNTVKVRGFLECGLGFSTAYFLNHADRVVSIEYVTPGYDDKWYQDCLTLYSDRPNWIPMKYNSDLRSNSFNNACSYQCEMHKDYALIDSTYLKELFQHFKTVIKKAEAENYPIDVAFVDPGIFIRGDMVKLLLALKIPIVATHDTDSDRGTEEEKNLYGWNKVITPPNYVKIYLPGGQGTTFWISEELPHVIASMQAYRDNIQQLLDLGIYHLHDLKDIADDMP
jgi:hypothetical protein